MCYVPYVLAAIRTSIFRDHAAFFLFFFFFNDTATTEIYTLSLHDALPIFCGLRPVRAARLRGSNVPNPTKVTFERLNRSEEHTSELQSHLNLVCRLLLEKKNHTQIPVALLTARYHTTNLGPRPRTDTPDHH